MDRSELMDILYRALTQLGQSRALLQHEETMLDLMQRAVNEPDFIAALRDDPYIALSDVTLTEFERDALHFAEKLKITEYRTQNTEYRIQNTEHGTRNTKHETRNTGD